MDDRKGITASSRVTYPQRAPVGVAGARHDMRTESGRPRGSADAVWPLSSGLGPLGALPTVPRVARSYTALVLLGWGLGDVVEDSQAVVSELAANAVHAATGEDGGPAYNGDGKLPVVWVRLMTNLALVAIEVWDTLPSAVGFPALRHAGPDAESGRGLEIVASLSIDWGWERVASMGGKRTWAMLAAGRAAPARG
jgi:hypothetical protein